MALAEQDDDPQAALIARLGAEVVDISEAALELASQDMFRIGARPLAVLRPRNTDEAASCVAMASELDLAIFPRGGGQSYTDGYQPTSARAVTVDLGAMDRVLEINTEDLFVRVEAGVTWARLDEELKPHGLRARFWGPFSGWRATVGGSLAQGTLTFGSTRNGPSGANVLSQTIVLADGSLLRTGADSQPHHPPFLREYGPDLTGLFAQDCGALGLKVEASLPLEPRPAHVEGLSYVFPDAPTLFAAMAAVGREGLASEILAMDPAVTRQFAGEQNLVQDFRSLIAIGRAAGNPVTALSRMARVALAGRSILKKEGFLGHFIAESRSKRELACHLDAIREIVKGGAPIAPTVPSFVRAQPFAPLPTLDPAGRRLLPIHALVPFSQANAAQQACEAVIDAHAVAAREAKMHIAMSYSVVNRNALLIEPVFYWEDSRDAFHTTYTPEEMLNNTPTFEHNSRARELIATMKQEMVDRLYELGAVHMQIGRSYPWARAREPAFLSVMAGLKKLVDPDNRMNPGALGLGHHG